MRSAEIYTPGIVPQHSEPEIMELERFLNDELDKISQALYQTTVMPAFGGVFVDAPHTGTLSIAPAQLVDFDSTIPAFLDRTEADGGFDSLTAFEAGAYVVYAQLYAELVTGRAYGIELYVNGSATGFVDAIDATNAQDARGFYTSGIINLAAGDILTLWGSADTNSSTFDIQSGLIMMHWVSPLIA